MHKCKVLGISVDAKPIAEGLKAMMDENELTALQFGMLPARMIESFERNLTARFQADLGVKVSGVRILNPEPGQIEEFEFTIKELVSEVTREVTLAIYEIGDLVV